MRYSVLIFVSLLTVAIAARNRTDNPHNLTLGQRSYRDQHLTREVVYKKSTFLRKVQDDWTFEQKTFPYPKTITQVVVTDQCSSGKGGYATLASGGPGSTFVKLHFKSQRGHGYNFVVDVFGE